MKKYAKVSENLEGKDFVFETGKLAKQADGSVFAQVGETQVLATVVSSHESVDGDFLPLTVNYQEKAFAAGKIPGGFFKREGRPTEAETLICRLIDRPLRPMFPKNYTYPTQIIISVYSADDANPPDVLALTAASAALTVSDIPWDDPIAAVRVGRIDGELVCNPTYEEIEKADLNFIVAGSSDAILMVEGGADVALEEDIIDALMYGHDQIKKLIEFQKKLIPDDLTKREVLEKETNSDLISSVTSLVSENIKSAATIKSKQERSSAFKEAYNSALVDLENDPNFDEKEVKSIFDKIRKDSIRKMMISDKVRIDGRGFEDIRDISSEINLLPRAHGSSVFTRGETQALVAVTLGSKEDQQRVDSLIGEEKKSFMLHYNFPPFSVGEVSMRLGTGRREIGHGELAKRAVQAVLPESESFPYTIRIVSDVLESNGSSSMATVCGSSLSLMDAGVPVKSPVAGIAMGLIKEGDDYIILSDILGDEDHLGDMDFKVCGTSEGITALQMDIKIKGISKDIMKEALAQAKNGRDHILAEMAKTVSSHKENISPYAPRITTIMVDPGKIKDIIGSGGKNIRKLIEDNNVKIDVDDTGRVNVIAVNEDDAKSALKDIAYIVRDIDVGGYYIGIVKRVLDFGAIVGLSPTMDGLIHVSELAKERVEKVTDILKEGDEVLVKCLEKGRDGKIRLSRKEALDQDIENFREE
ncbi:polyribonucleotide nucleotidyltransferase [bacterium]|jgi:polyribonucleotide nucleotidyltransferase|nr:polyribonucleotide nucleotidyltransferase [bacterium]MBT3849896.1 polyribonucleotide nucleotidyltransferase [bacterium]|tara:strand:- start:1670 stop:3772 length:2103 start_codon:yes stop_codon:yes gene_type:complete